MLRILNPLHENHTINSRNSAAHRFSIVQARESTTGNRHTHLLKWVDILGAFEKDEQTWIGKVAFQHAYPVSSEMVERCELHSSLMAVKSAPEEIQLECAGILHKLNNLRLRQEMLEQEEDDRALMRASGIRFPLLRTDFIRVQ